MLKRVLITTTAISALTIAGCATMKNPSTDRNLGLLQNKDWVVSEIYGVEYKADPAKTTNIPHLIFDNSALSGSDGCNRLMGGYTVKGTKIALSQLAKTQMSCLNATDISDKFSQALGEVSSYKVTEKELKLLNGNNKVILELRNK